MKTSSINFGTTMHIASSKNVLLSLQPEKFIDGLILAEKKMAKNGIQDELILDMNRPREARDNKFDTLTLSYRSTSGEFNPIEIIKKIKDLPRRTKNIEKFFLDALSQLQPPETKVKTVHLSTSKEQDKATLKLAKADFIVDKNGFDDITCA
ncbi:MAG: hypothetical protein WCF95_05025 [bacterium]